MSPAVPLSEIQIENVTFPPAVKPPASNNTLFLGGAGAWLIHTPVAYANQYHVISTEVFFFNLLLPTWFLYFYCFVLTWAGVRGLEIEGKFIKFTAIGVYLEDNSLQSLAAKWKGKIAKELTDSVEFFRDIVRGKYLCSVLDRISAKSSVTLLQHGNFDQSGVFRSVLRMFLKFFFLKIY